MLTSKLFILFGFFGLALSAYPSHYEVGYGFVNHGGIGPHGHYLPGSAKVKVHKDPFQSTYAVDEEGPTHYKYVRHSTASDPILHHGIGGHIHGGVVGVGVGAVGFPGHLGHGHHGHGIVGGAVGVPVAAPIAAPVHGVIGGVGPAVGVGAVGYPGAVGGFGGGLGHHHYGGGHHLGAAAAIGAPYAGYGHAGHHGVGHGHGHGHHLGGHGHLGGIHGHGHHHGHHHGGYY